MTAEISLKIAFIETSSAYRITVPGVLLNSSDLNLQPGDVVTATNKDEATELLKDPSNSKVRIVITDFDNSDPNLDGTMLKDLIGSNPDNQRSIIIFTEDTERANNVVSNFPDSNKITIVDKNDPDLKSPDKLIFAIKNILLKINTLNNA